MRSRLLFLALALGVGTLFEGPLSAKSREQIMLCGLKTPQDQKTVLIFGLRHANDPTDLIDPSSVSVFDPNNILGSRRFTKFVRDNKRIIGTVGDATQALPMFFVYATSPDDPTLIYARFFGPKSATDLTVVDYVGTCGYPPAPDIEIAWSSIQRLPGTFSE